MTKKPTRRAYIGTFATSLFIQGCTVLQGILLARLLGPEGRGEFASVMLWPNVFAGFGIFGVNMALARLAGQGWNVNGLIKTAVRAALVTGSISMLVCGALLPILLPQEKHNLLPAAYMFLMFIPLSHIGLNLQGVDHGKADFRWLNITRAVLYPVYFIGLILTWYFATNAVFWGIAALLVANGFVVLLRLLAKYRAFLSEGGEVSLQTLWKESASFVVASIISILYMQMDKVLLVWLLTPGEIGWYVAAFAAASSVNVLNGALGIVQFSTSAQTEKRMGFVYLANVLRRSFFLTFICSCMLAALIPWMLPLVYGEDFRPAITVAFLLLPGAVLAGLGEIVNQALRGQGQPVAAVFSKILGLFVMGGVGFVLSRFLAERGIALGYLVGEFVAFGGILVMALRYYNDASLTALLPSKVLLYLKKGIFKGKGGAVS